MALTAFSSNSQVFNLQRLAVLTASLSTAPLNADVIWEAMRDKVHQPQREGLVRPRSLPRNATAAGGPDGLAAALALFLVGAHARFRTC